MRIIAAEIGVDPNGTKNCVEIMPGESPKLNDVLTAAEQGNAVTLFKPDGTTTIASGIIIKLPYQNRQQILAYPEVESVLAKLAS